MCIQHTNKMVMYYIMDLVYNYRLGLYVNVYIYWKVTVEKCAEAKGFKLSYT